MKLTKLFFKNGLMLIGLALIFSQSAQAVDIVGFTLNSGDISTGVSPATSGLAANASATMTTTGVTTSSFSSGTGQTCYNFTTVGTSGWKTTIFSTALYEKLTIGFQMKATGTGPRDFQGQYSTNGTNYYNIPDDPTDATDNPAFSLTTGFLNYKFVLPAECNNKANLYIRWVVRTSSKVTGTGNYGFTSLANATMYGITVQGELFKAPTSQAKDISIRSVTPTTITVGCSHGTGNRRVLYMNSTNSFTNPIDDTPLGTPNTTYVSGQQLVYDGTGDQVTVTVPDSKNTYWFKYYEYNMLDQLIKIDVNFLNPDGTTPISGNPKECKLENIHSPTAAFGLTRATLSAIIDTPTKSEIIERGFYYSTEPNVNDTDNGVNINEKSTQGGPFSLQIPGGVERATTIYFKAYVINASGKILSDEASFNNTPVFTGTGNWETAARWNVGEIPGANGDATYGDTSDSPIIRGICTLTSDNQVADLTVESGKLTINKATSLNVTGTLTSDNVSKILIKSIEDISDLSANGSLAFAEGSPKATVEMYSKATWNISNPVNQKFKWQFFGIPVKSLIASSTFNFRKCFVREWDESVTSMWDVWSKRNDNSTLYKDSLSLLSQSKGYELVQQFTKLYTFAGDLLDGNFTQTLSYTPTAAYKGQNIFGNPYTSAISIKDQLSFTNAVQAVYLYNTGTFNDWNGGTVPGSGPGQYTVSTPGTAGIVDGVPTQIPSMQSFLIQSLTGGGSFTINRTGLTKNTDKQRVKSNTLSTPNISLKIDVIGTNSSDRMWLVVNSVCTRNFDNGYDGPKILGSAEVTQLYGLEADGNYQINVVSDINESYLGFQPGTDTQFKLIFNHQNTDSKYSSIYLTDLIANKTVDITQTGTEYSFTAASNDVIKRFKISAITKTTTGLNSTDQSSLINIYGSQNSIFIDNMTDHAGEMSLYNALGSCIRVSPILPNELNQFNLNLNKGVYFVKATINAEKVTKSIIIN
jgi:hypothetical protein